MFSSNRISISYTIRTAGSAENPTFGSKLKKKAGLSIHICSALAEGGVPKVLYGKKCQKLTIVKVSGNCKENFDSRDYFKGKGEANR